MTGTGLDGGTSGPSGLRLVPLTAESLRALALHPGRALVQDGLEGVTWPEDALRVVRYRNDVLDADPASWPWLLHAAIEDGHVVGHIGCHSAPVDGRVEVGYYVRADARGRGVATRMLAAFSQWLTDHGVSTVALTVSPDNAASLRIVHRSGYVEVGEQWDEEDGLELVFERSLTAGLGS